AENGHGTGAGRRAGIVQAGKVPLQHTAVTREANSGSAREAARTAPDDEGELYGPVALIQDPKRELVGWEGAPVGRVGNSELKRKQVDGITATRASSRARAGAAASNDRHGSTAATWAGTPRRSNGTRRRSTRR